MKTFSDEFPSEVKCIPCANYRLSFHFVLVMISESVGGRFWILTPILADTALPDTSHSFLPAQKADIIHGFTAFSICCHLTQIKIKSSFSGVFIHKSVFVFSWFLSLFQMTSIAP